MGSVSMLMALRPSPVAAKVTRARARWLVDEIVDETADILLHAGRHDHE